MKVLKLSILLVFFSIYNKNYSQVNLQAGSAIFNLPVQNWQDTKSRLNLNIGIVYNSGNGFKVDEVASNLGQGWGLIAGGVITRRQIGQPDDQPEKTGAWNDIYKYPAGYLYNNLAQNNNCPQGLRYYPISSTANEVYKQHNVVAADKELDNFTFEANGKTLNFVLKKNSNHSTNQVVVLGDSRVKIWYTQNANLQAPTGIGVRTTIDAFFVQDETGVLYKFNKLAYTKVLRINKYGLSDDLPSSAKPYVINKWFLTEMEDVINHRKISFVYENGYTTLQSRFINLSTHLNYNSFQGDKISSNVISIPQIELQPRFISIIYPDGGNTDFNYDINNPRIDLAGDYPLLSIQVNYATRVAKRLDFKTSYFVFNQIKYPSSSKEKKAARLCLQSIIPQTFDLRAQQNPYTFDYYLGSNNTEDFVPPLNYAIKDPWGYYNGNKLDSYLPSGESTIESNYNLDTDLSYALGNLTDKQIATLCYLDFSKIRSWLPDCGNPKIPNFWNVCIKNGYAKNGLIKQINYPTGGLLQYEYEQNTGTGSAQNWDADSHSSVSIGAITANIGGVHVSKTILTDGGYSNGVSNSITTNYNFSPCNLTENPSDYYEDLNMNYVFFQPEGGQHHIFAGCSYDIDKVCILSDDAAYSVQSINYSEIQLKSFLKLGRTIADLFVAGTVGVIIDIMVIVVVVLEEIDAMNAGCNDYVGSDSWILSNNSNYFINPPPLLFDKVTVIISGKGRSEYEFTTTKDYPLWEPFNEFLNAKPRYAPWAYGKIKKITNYDENSKIVSQIENVYDYSRAKQDPEMKEAGDIYNSCNCNAKAKFSKEKSVWQSYDNTSLVQSNTETVHNLNDNTWGSTRVYHFTIEPYKYYSGRVELIRTFERSYKNGNINDYIETKTEYDYNTNYYNSNTTAHNNYMVQRITTTESNGDKKIKEIAYTSNYNLEFGSQTSAALQSFYDNNILNIPIATYNSVIKAGTSNKIYLSGDITEYGIVNGDLLPIRKWSGRSKQPITGFNKIFDIANFSTGYPNLSVTQEYSYDAGNNLILTKDEGARAIHNVYDYNNKLVVATIVNPNTTSTPFYGSYSSFETTGLGGWITTGNVQFDPESVTGNRSLILNTTNKISSIFSSICRLTFWAKSSVSINVIGGSAVITNQGPTINGFTLYEYKITSPTSSNSTLEITGNTKIDELRLYPFNARISTTTYDEILGKTSECDENNRVIYYEYDDWGRLQFIKDEKKDILKMYEYNTK